MKRIELTSLGTKAYPPQPPENPGHSVILIGIGIFIWIVVVPILLVFIPLLKCYQFLSRLVSGKAKPPDVDELLKQEWRPFVSSAVCNIEGQFIRSIPWAEGLYKLRSAPEIPFLKDKIFVEWSGLAFDGILLEQFHDYQDCTLVFISHDMIVSEVKRLQSREWSLSHKEGQFFLECKGISGVTTYKLKLISDNTLSIT